MKKADCFHLGYIAKLHGYKGEVSLFLDVTDPQDYAGIDAVFLDINDQLTPFFIETIKLKQKGFAAVKFEGVDDESTARKLLRKDAYLPESVLPKLSGTRFYDHEVIGFDVIDAVHGNIGKLEQVIDFKVNPLLQIDHSGKEVLVPLLDDTVTKVDRGKNQLHITTPEGLVQLYIGE